jgi:hypothetical protein
LSRAFKSPLGHPFAAFHEIDFAGIICDPPSTARTELIDLFLAIAERNGNSYFLGRSLPHMLDAAGLTDVVVQPITHYHPIGDPRRSLFLDFAGNFVDRIVGAGLVSRAVFDVLCEEVRELIADPRTAIFIGPYVQAWGTKAR